MSCRYIVDHAWLTCLSYFGGECAYCGTTRGKLTADHLVPVSQGGQDIPENIVPACEKCNQAKADTEWREYMMSTPHFSQDRLNRIFNWRRICSQAKIGDKNGRGNRQ